MTAGICSGTPGPRRLLVAGALLAVERADQQLDLARPADRKNPGCRRRRPRASGGDDRDDRLRPCHLGAQRLTVSIGNRPLTFGVTSTTPMSAAWVSDGPNESNGRTSSDLRINVPSTTVTPSATPITLSSVRRQSAINAARWIRRKDSHPARSLCITAPRWAWRR